MSKRHFEVETPIGTLHIYAKHEGNFPEDYPGVYIDLVGRHENILLACVEYDSGKKRMQTCVYSDGFEEAPTHVILHNNTDEDLNPRFHEDDD